MAVTINGNLAYKYKEQEEQKQKRIITKTKKVSIPVREKLFYIFAVIFAVILSGIVISGYAQIAEYSYSIQKVESSIIEINRGNEELQKKIAELSSPERIITTAREELGMTLDEEQVIVLNR